MMRASHNGCAVRAPSYNIFILLLLQHRSRSDYADKHLCTSAQHATGLLQSQVARLLPNKWTLQCRQQQLQQWGVPQLGRFKRCQWCCQLDSAVMPPAYELSGQNAADSCKRQHTQLNPHCRSCKRQRRIRLQQPTSHKTEPTVQGLATCIYRQQLLSRQDKYES